MITSSDGSASNPNWHAIRQIVLRRDGFSCQECKVEVRSADADIHHVLPRSMGGTDEIANLITLCDGCHAARHPRLAGGLARRLMERWAVRLVLWLDRDGQVAMASKNFGPALRLLGVQSFRDGQLPIVEAALSGRSLLVVSPTGSGKTLCFQLPALLKPGLSLVISPLKVLMARQVSDLLRKQVPATFINGDLSKEEKGMRYDLAAKTGVKLLHVAPERFNVQSSAEREAIASLRPPSW